MNQLRVGKSGKQFILTDVVAYWAKVHTPTPKYKKPDEKEYSIELLINEDTVDAIDDSSFNKQPSDIKAKNKKAIKKKGEAAYPAEYEDLFSLKLTSSSTWPDGKEKKIKVVMNHKPFEENIGNGSIVDVIGRIGKQNDEGLHTVYLEQVNVKDFVEYEDGTDFDFESEDTDFASDEFED